MQHRTKHYTLPLSAVLLILLFLKPSANGQFVANGNASAGGNGCWNLTDDSPGQAGSIFSLNSINLNAPFFYSTRLNFGCKDANGADGIVFIFATTNTALGTGGGGIGYQNISPSIAIEWDDYQNGGFGDPASDHVAIMRNGSVNHGSPDNLAGPITLPNIEDCNEHCVTISWTPSNQTLTGTIDGVSISYSGDIINSIFGGNPNVFWGFSSGTGSLSNLHQVCDGPPQVQPMADQQICPGESVQLQADPNGDSYFWAPHPTLSNFTIPDPVATPVNTTLYSVTITYPCGGTAVDDVLITVLPPPVASATSNSPVCNGETLNLMANGGMSYSWEGPQGFSSNQQNPSVSNMQFDNAGLYTVTVTGANDCTATASTLVTVLPPAVVAIVPPPQPFCSSDPPYTLEGIPAGGTWGGAANSSGQVDPAALGPGMHLVTYTATDINNCTGTAELLIEVTGTPTVAIAAAGPFCEDDSVQVLSATPTGGTWGGVADTLGQVFPQQLGPGSYLVTYTAGPPNCAATDSLMIAVLNKPLVSINAAGPHCASDPPDTLTASPPGGSWSGVADSLGIVEPANLTPGLHQVIYTWSDSINCAASDTLEIEVFALPEATVSGGGTICDNGTETATVLMVFSGQAPFVVNWSVDGQPQAPISTAQDTFMLNTSTPGIVTVDTIMDANGCQNSGTGSAQVVVVGSPQVSGLAVNCDSTGLQYTVSFQISGGDSASYTVNGGAGTLTPGSPALFTSATLLSGDPYLFEVFDAFGCDTTIISGAYSCSCISDAGDMDNTLVEACPGDTLSVTHLGGEVLDGNDTLSFVLHSSNSNALGTVYAIHSTPDFWLVPPMQPGVIYYVSAVAGNDDGSGLVDLNDPCLSVSLGQPVRFNIAPTADLADDAEICEGETATLVFNLSGSGPFNVLWSDGTDSTLLTGIFDGHTEMVSPGISTTYTLISIEDSNSPACAGNPGDSVLVTVHPIQSASTLAFLCPGDSLFAGGSWQMQAGFYRDTLASQFGCDSIVITEIQLLPQDSTLLTDSTCDPAAAGVFMATFTNQSGCDSVVITTVSLLPTDTTFINGTSCDPAAVGTFTEVFSNQSGCDSTVITTISLLPSDTTFLTDSTCDPMGTGTFTNVFSNQFGCDSTVITTVTFSEADTTLLSDSTCDPQQSGVFVQNLTAADGCDSVVITTVSLLPTDTTFVADASCAPNAAGTFTAVFNNQFGCDSVVITTVSLLPTDTTFVADASCDPNAAGTFTSVFNNQFGCDSVVITTVSLLPTDTTFVADASCAPNAAGTFTAVFNNQFGCDSVVITTVSLLPTDTTFVADASCDPNAAGTFTAVFNNQFGCDSVVITTVSLLPTDTTWLQTFTCLPADTGSVTTVLSNQWGCDSIVVAAVGLWPLPEVTASATTHYNGYHLPCAGDDTGLAEAGITGGTPPFAVTWSDGQSGPQAMGLSAGTYQVTIADSNGCRDSATVSLTEPPPLELSFIINPPDCFDQAEGYLEVLPEGGVAPYLFSVNGGPYTGQSAYPNLPAGTYQVAVLDANNCPAAEIAWLNAPLPVDVNLGNDMLIQLGDDTLLQAFVNLPFDSLAQITWTGIDSSECPTCLTQPVAPVVTTTYSIEVTDVHGCSDADQVTVTVDRRKQVYVPNAFSPNNDGVNDIFFINAKPGTVAKVRSFLVFSRWGETVFEYYNFQPNDPAYGWDGNYRNQAMDPAVFAWFAEIEFTDGKVVLYEGDVVLMR